MALGSGLTFAEAYDLQKKKEKSRSGSKISLARNPSFANAEQLNELIVNLIGLLEEDSPICVREFRKSFQNVPPSASHLVSSWRDENDLDIVHHSIINDAPEVLNFLFTETDFFPPRSQPVISPYAHLAASLGMQDCLKIILIDRPDDYFLATLPQHAVKLPDALVKKFKLSEGAGPGLNKKVDSILNKIKVISENAEARMSLDPGNDDIDFSDLEKDLKGRDRALQSAGRRKRQKLSTLSDTSNRGGPSGKRKKSEAPASGKNGKDTSAEITLDQLQAKRERKSLKKREHSITVYVDAFRDEAPGVVGGAGVNVKVKKDVASACLPPIAIKDNDIALAATAAVQEYAHSSRRRSHGSISRSRSSIDAGSGTSLSASSGTSIKKVHSRLPSIVQDAAINTGGHKIEMGVRGKKRYKDFRLKTESKLSTRTDDRNAYMNKTPLTLAAERGHMDCVQLILDLVILKQNPLMVTNEPLTLATKARSPETILLLLTRKISRTDYQGAVITAIRELFPDCLAALLSTTGRERHELFEGTNLYHILYSQSLVSDYRYEMMPEMTNVLISSGEDVNAHKVSRTFPMYTLINCAFNITVGKQIYFYLECLEILLDAKANPHYDEMKSEAGVSRSGIAVSRNGYRSAINCILSNAQNSVNFFESSYWSRLFMKKMITTIESRDKTQRRVLNEILFDYMDSVCTLGVDRTILKTLLKYGGNPDYKRDEKYAINVFFDNVLPYLTRFEVIGSYERYLSEMDHLMLMCRGMSQKSLKEALRIFLDDTLLSTPIQGLPVARYFCYLMRSMLPLRLTDLAAQFLWTRLKRNKRLVRQLPVSNDIIALILP